MSRRGMFVVLEGLDAAGKATQSTRLVSRFGGAALFSFPMYDTITGKALRRHLHGEIFMCEERLRDSSDMSVDGDPYYARCAEDPLAFQGLMTMEKYRAAPKILKLLSAGVDVVCDRWWPSGEAFGVAEGLPKDLLVEVHELLPTPDLCIFINTSPEVALQRRPKLRDRNERDREKQTRVRDNYLALWDEMKWPMVDGNATVEEVGEQIWKLVVERMKLRELV